ncbi:MAG: MFS transporter [Acidimicrobiales bacterium]
MTSDRTTTPGSLGGDEPPTQRSRQGLALVVVMIGVLITAVDTTIVILALPEIETGLHVALASVIWVIIGYLLVITLLATQVGRLGDMFGRVRMYEAGFLIFVIGSALCALSWNETSIIAFRIIQGIGGALVTANSGAVIADLFPIEKRGKAYGYNAVGWTIGAVLGIVLGGLIVTYVSWRWVFWINVPIGLVALALAFKVLDQSSQRQSRHLDWVGMTTFGLGLFGLLWAITELATKPLTPALIGYLVGGVVLLAIFPLVEWRQAEPMLDLRLFKVPTMTPSLLASLFQGLANFAVLFLVIMYLQGPRGLSPIHASLLLVPGYVIAGGIGPLSGRLADRVGAVLPATLGLAIQVVALFVYAQMQMHTGLWLIVVASVINGIGSAFFFPANSSAVMKASPPQVFGISSGMLRTFANVGMVFSFSVAILIASRTVPRSLAFAIFVGSTTLKPKVAAAFTTGLHSAFYASIALMAIAALLSATRGLKNLRRTSPVARETAAYSVPTSDVPDRVADSLS